MYAVSKSVIDLRKTPIDLASHDFSHHSQRDSQLLYGDPVHILATKGDWYQVTAPSQGNYPGWVRTEEVMPLLSPYSPNVVVCHTTFLEHAALPLFYGTLLHSTYPGKVLLPNGHYDTLDPTALRPSPSSFDSHLLFRDAEQFLHAPYLWGGCSAPSPGHIQSVDCSGLVYLLHRAQGLLLPRDAKEQALCGTPSSHPLPGSVFCLHHTPKAPAHHILLALTPSLFLEAPCTGEHVRLLHWNQNISSDGTHLHIEGRTPCPFSLKVFS